MHALCLKRVYECALGSKCDGEPAKMNTKRKSSVGLRWLTALVLIPIVLLFAWFGGWAAFAATAVIVVLGVLELHSMLVQAGFRPLLWISLGLSLLFLVSAMLPQQRLLLLEAGLALSLLISFTWLLFRKTLDGVVVDWALTLANALYLGWPMSLLLLLRGNQAGIWMPAVGGWVALPAGAWWLLVTLLGVWSFDSAAFFVGRYFGRHKLAPRISPAKTWEGALGGLLLCILTCLVVTVGPLGVPWYLAIVLAFLISMAATLGDLAESLIKRQMNTKDSGQIVPGHGGLLDRVDSTLFAIMVVYFFSLIFQAIV